MPTTFGTTPIRCPPLTASVTFEPAASLLPAGGFWSRTVPFGAVAWKRVSPCSDWNPD